MPVPPADDPLAQLSELPGVADAVARARRRVDTLLGHRMLRQRSAEVSAESALRGARASAALDGGAVALAELRSGAVLEQGAPHAALLAAALRVTAEVGSLQGTWGRAPAQALARLHVAAAGGRVETEELGRPRGAGVRPEDPLGLGPAPEPEEVATRLELLAGLLTRKSSTPAIVLAAVVHGELAVLRPFTVGSGLVARAAERLVLVARGLDPKAVSVPEVGHLELGGAAYAAALQGYATGTPAGLARWVEHCAQAIGLGAREGVAVCEALQRGVPSSS